MGETWGNECPHSGDRGACAWGGRRHGAMNVPTVGIEVRVHGEGGDMGQ